MSSSRFANLFVTPSLRWRASTFNGLVLAAPAARAVARGFHHSAINAASAKAAVKRTPEERSEEQVAKDLEGLAAMAHYTRVDVWNQPVQTLGK